jgi:hypothetical protein
MGNLHTYVCIQQHEEPAVQRTDRGEVKEYRLTIDESRPQAFASRVGGVRLLSCDVYGGLYPPNSTMSAMRSASVSGSTFALFARMITENRCSGNRRISVLNPTVLPS